MVNAYILLNTQLSSESEVIKELKIIEGIKETYVVYGVYDIIAHIEADTLEDLTNILTSKVRRINKVRSTLTMIVV